MAVSSDRTSPNNTTGEYGSQDQNDRVLSLFPVESNEPYAPAIHTAAMTSSLVNGAPVVFVRVPLDPSLIVDIEDPPTPRRSSSHIAPLQRYVARVARPYTIDLRRASSETVDNVRLSLLFAIVIAAGGLTIAIHALDSVDRARSTSRAAPPATAEIPLAVTAPAPQTPTAPVPVTHEVSGTPSSGATPDVQSRPTNLNRRTRAFVSERSKRPSPVAAARFHGRLIITSEPKGATVLINQRPVGVTPLELPRYPASSYAVWVQHEGYQRWTAGVLVPANAVTRVSAQLRKAPPNSANRSFGP